MDYDRLRELQEKFDENPRRYFAPLANEYRKGGQQRRAIEICREQLAHMPGHMSGQIVYGQALYETGEFDEARKVFQSALTVDPENLIGLKLLGDMALQAGNTVEARNWYVRLLDADPKDTVAIALVSEIDAAAEAAPVPLAAEIPGVDPDAGDQQIPAVIQEAPALQPEPSSPAPSSVQSAEPVASEQPAGLERNYPLEEASHEPIVTGTHTAIDGISSSKPDDSGPLGGVSSAKREESPLGDLSSAKRDDDNALDSWAPPSGAAMQETSAPPPEARAPVPTRSEGAPEEKEFTGASAEPFVNETMAQLYLQQGYRQLALKVYRQLSDARPHDQSLKDRIADIQAEDAAEHPVETRVGRKEESPRSPSIESPTPPTERESEEAPSFDRSPVDSPPTSQPSRRRESIEAPTREEPRAEPEGIGARQPSIREFFATLGRRRPPRGSSSPGPRSGNNQPPESGASLGASPPGASLDTVFAGATVSPSDSRAASRLAGAFSGGAGGSRTPPTPPMPTPRVNPRMPHAPESEEDVAKFRAWLDGLTGE